MSRNAEAAASPNLEAMIRRKQLMRQGNAEAEIEAEAILEEVLRNGGLTTDESYALMAY